MTISEMDIKLEVRLKEVEEKLKEALYENPINKYNYWSGIKVELTFWLDEIRGLND
jgi:hypothetical protein